MTELLAVEFLDVADEAAVRWEPIVIFVLAYVALGLAWVRLSYWLGWVGDDAADLVMTFLVWPVCAAFGMLYILIVSVLPRPKQENKDGEV